MSEREQHPPPPHFSSHPIAYSECRTPGVGPTQRARCLSYMRCLQHFAFVMPSPPCARLPPTLALALLVGAARAPRRELENNGVSRRAARRWVEKVIEAAACATDPPSRYMSLSLRSRTYSFEAAMQPVLTPTAGNDDHRWGKELTMASTHAMHRSIACMPL